MAQVNLTQVAKTIKSELVLITLVILILSLLVIALVKPFKKSPQVTWKEGVTAGKSTRQELESRLGKPVKIGDDQTYFFDSGNQYRPHQVQFSQDIVEIVKEQVIGNEKGKLDGFIKRYGSPQEILYGQHGTFAPGHFWGNLGLLVFANQQDGTVVEIWYFEPIDVEGFLAKQPDLKRTIQPY